MKEKAKAQAFDRSFLIKTLIMSNMIVALVLCSVLTAFAGETYAQKVRLNLEYKNVPLQTVMDDIKKQTEFEFAYESDIEDIIVKKVSVHAKNELIDDVMQKVLKGTGIKFRIIDKIILLSNKEMKTTSGNTEMQPQKIVVSGMVKDKTGPLPGVSINIKNTYEGTTSDQNGSFTLSVPDLNATLVFSYIGYLTQEIPLAGRSKLDVLMVQDVMNLDEVVVVGYGTQRKKDLTGAVSTVNGNDLQKLPVANVEQALQGQVAGVQVTQNYGNPGAGVQIRIRGIGTIGDSDPLYVIDGVPTKEGINSLNTIDIESISILKDASAAAIYGARAANGVVLITTKKGQTGVTQVQFNTQYGVQQISKKLDLLTADQYTMVMDEALKNDGLEPVWNNPGLGAGTDWQDVIFRKAAFRKYDLSVTSGTENTSYLLGIGYYGQDGIVKYSDFTRYNVRFNLNSNISKKFTVGTNMNISRISEDLIDTEINGVVRSAIFQPPTISVYNEDGSYAGPGANEGDAQNPLGMADRSDKTSLNNKLFGSLFATYQIIPSLKFKSNLGLNVYSLQTKDFDPTFSEGNANRQVNSLTTRDVEYFDVTWENTLDYTKEFRDHTFNILAGSTLQDAQTNTLTGYRESFINNEGYLQYLDAGSANDKARGNMTEWSLLSYFGRINYDYAGKYLLSVNTRFDGSSRFGKSNRWGVFPSASAGWRISKESFFNVPFIDDLKVRASWGQLGNQDIGLYAFTSTLQQIYYTFGNPQSIYVGYYPASDFNPDVKWETTTQLDFGFDMYAFDYRLYFSADYYKKNTSDMLLILPQPATSGFGSTGYENLGEVENKGWEFQALWRDKIGKVGYNISANVTTSKNKVLELGEYSDAITTGLFFDMSTRTEVGHSIREFYGYVTDGIFQNQDEVDAANAKAAELNGEGTVYQNLLTAPGDIRFKDLNKDGKINSDDRTFIGNPYPDLFIGLNMGLNYRNFDFSMFFQGQFGNDIYNATDFWLTNSGYNYNKGTAILDRWTGEGTSNSEPRLTTLDPNQNARGSDRYIEDGSYVRLKNLQLGYTLPESASQKIWLKGLRVFVTATNLLTFTDYTGYDPEVGAARATLGDRTVGFDEVTYPQNKSFIVGLNVTL
ncbi:MAG TPA: TonB-dependent receptor [Bacteroidales bacterium]|mgnify:CR=1 FL=1|nr:TonB-dependent receptor [Bacteroidales bacterium]HPT03272.1 TonB-dependent receptor [Bacteroidales bacterium]